jgi:hypothetical protein
MFKFLQIAGFSLFFYAVAFSVSADASADTSIVIQPSDFISRVNASNVAVQQNLAAQLQQLLQTGKPLSSSPAEGSSVPESSAVSSSPPSVSVPVNSPASNSGSTGTGSGTTQLNPY